MINLRVLILGIYFGIVLVKSQVVSWFRIQQMFRFEDPYMYQVIISAVIVGAISLLLIKRTHRKTIDGEEIVVTGKPFNKGVIAGGIIFGMGWAITGACPGPIYAQIGSGATIAIVTFVAALAGSYLFAVLQPRLPF